MSSRQALAVAQISPKGPVVAASRFVNAILGGDVAAAWPLVEDRLRRWLIDAWITQYAHEPELARRDRGKLRDALAADVPLHHLWPSFAASLLLTLAEAWAHVDPETFAWATDPRPIGLDVEAVVYAQRPAHGDAYSEDVLVPGITISMRRGDGEWRVAGFEEPSSD
jgi:hypothetical protein